jgi:hypothetical protein
LGRYNRTNTNLTKPRGDARLRAYAAQLLAGRRARLRAHIWNEYHSQYHYGYTNTSFATFDGAAGTEFTDAIHFTQAGPRKDGRALGPGISISNGYTRVSQFAATIGPQENNDFHGDLTKIVGNQTISASVECEQRGAFISASMQT